MNKKLKQESGDKEMNQINKLIDDENRAAEAIASGVKLRPNYQDRQAAMKIVQKYKLSGQRESDAVKGGSSRKVIKGKNIPGGLFKTGGVKKKAGGLREATARLKAQGLKKGGKKKKFPDLSGDGKVTMKDILMGRGIIKKTKKKTKKSKS